MVELDGDEVRISSRGRYAERDIVQVRLTIPPLFFFYCSVLLSLIVLTLTQNENTSKITN